MNGLKQTLACLLILLIGSQSVLAAADSHGVAQDSGAHQEAEHHHSDSHPDLLSDANLEHAEDINGVDCDHCCHCHTGVQGVPAVANIGAIIKSAVTARVSAGSFSSLSFPPVKPPPII